MTNRLSFISTQSWSFLSLIDILIPILFIVAGFSTFDYSTIKDKWNRKFVWWGNFVIIGVIITSAIETPLR